MSEYYVEYKDKRWYRYGCIRIASNNVLDTPERIFTAFHKIRFLPTKVEHDLVEGMFVYYGLSPAFKPVAPGEKALVYDLFINPLGLFDVERLEVEVRQKEG